MKSPIKKPKIEKKKIKSWAALMQDWHSPMVRLPLIPSKYRETLVLQKTQFENGLF